MSRFDRNIDDLIKEAITDGSAHTDYLTGMPNDNARYGLWEACGGGPAASGVQARSRSEAAVIIDGWRFEIMRVAVIYHCRPSPVRAASDYGFRGLLQAKRAAKLGSQAAGPLSRPRMAGSRAAPIVIGLIWTAMASGSPTKANIDNYNQKSYKPTMTNSSPALRCPSVVQAGSATLQRRSGSISNRSDCPLSLTLAPTRYEGDAFRMCRKSRQSRFASGRGRFRSGKRPARPAAT